jgi:hypothetical protein
MTSGLGPLGRAAAVPPGSEKSGRGVGHLRALTARCPSPRHTRPPGRDEFAASATSY